MGEKESRPHRQGYVGARPKKKGQKLEEGEFTEPSLTDCELTGVRCR
jgi:hypothetical protein